MLFYGRTNSHPKVVRGLGHGLDESPLARRKIQFNRPERRHPADFEAV